MNYIKITVPLSKQEEDLLRMAANLACRRPRDHARYIILNSLGLVIDDGPDTPKKNNRQAAPTSTGPGSLAVAEIHP